MYKTKILIFVVAYNAEKHIEEVIARIPRDIIASDHYEILLIDDSSQDNTYEKSIQIQRLQAHLNLKVLSNPQNLGYGGNQKVGYKYAIDHEFDIVALLHGDGQYAPELLGSLLAPIRDHRADVVFGSRMMDKKSALRGGMPIYKWLGNQVLTFLLNRILGVQLSEFHSGYRIFSVETLRRIPFGFNSDYYDFDTDIIVQCIDTHQRILEKPIPTFYGDEVSYVNGLKYAYLILKTAISARLVQLHWINNRKYQYGRDNISRSLRAIASLHSDTGI